MSVLLSVIIPTYDRASFLRETLNSVVEQTWLQENYEVVVVDDGSTDSTHEICCDSYPFKLQYVRQQNQGDAAARNTGVRVSVASFLVFIDDDILLSPNYLETMFAAHLNKPQHILMSRMKFLPDDGRAPLQRISATSERNEQVGASFVDLQSNSMALSRGIYQDVGMMEALDFPGSDIWCDVDFAYRAYQRGIQFARVHEAICYHRDRTLRSLNSASERMYAAGFRATALFKKYPGLPEHLPMFEDKMPRLPNDTAKLTVRKFVRPLASSRPVLAGLVWLAQWLESSYPNTNLLRPLYRWIAGGYLYRGYRDGRAKPSTR